MDAIDLLVGDHNRVRGLIVQFKSAHESDDQSKLASIASKLITELEAHTAIEEEIFYPATRQLSDDIDETTEEGLQEHHVVKQLITEINELEAGTTEWVAKMKVMIENVEHHAEEEETELFPKIRSHSDIGMRKQLADQLEVRKQQLGAPTLADAQGLTKEVLVDLAREQEIPGRSSMDVSELARTVDARASV